LRLAEVGEAVLDGRALAKRRAGLTHLAGAFLMLFVAGRLRRDGALIALPIAFVLCNLARRGDLPVDLRGVRGGSRPSAALTARTSAGAQPV
jgi:hypothetical protein